MLLNQEKELSKKNRQERCQVAHKEVNPVKSVGEKLAISEPKIGSTPFE